jgi:hypothetical protein
MGANSRGACVDHDCGGARRQDVVRVLSLEGAPEASGRYAWAGSLCCRRHGKHAVVVREAPCAVVAGPYRPVYAAPCEPVVYREVYRPGYWQWHETSRCHVWVPGATIIVRFNEKHKPYLISQENVTG